MTKLPLIGQSALDHKLKLLDIKLTAIDQRYGRLFAALDAKVDHLDDQRCRDKLASWNLDVKKD